MDQGFGNALQKGDFRFHSGTSQGLGRKFLFLGLKMMRKVAFAGGVKSYNGGPVRQENGES